MLPASPPASPPAARPSAEYAASFVSRFFFSWLSPLFTLAQTRTLSETDLLGVSGDDSPSFVSRRFQLLLGAHAQEAHPVRAALVAQFWGPMMVAGGLRLLNSTLNFAPSLLLYGLLSSLQQGVGTLYPAMPSWSGYAWALAMFFSLALRTNIENQYFHCTVRVGFQVRSALATAVYRKALCLSSASRQDTPVGTILNLMQIDATRLDALMLQLHSVWDSFYQILGYLALLAFYVGPSCLAGLLTMLCVMPAQAYLMVVLSRYRRAISKATDQRIKVTNEVLQGIRAVKMYSWEEAYAGFVQATRETELKALRDYSLVEAFNLTLMNFTPVAVTLATLSTYAATGGDFSPARIFSAIQVLSAIRFPLLFLPMVMAQLTDAKVSLARLDRFIKLPEVEGMQPLEVAAVAVAEEGGPAVSAALGLPSQEEAALLIEGDAIFHWEQPAARENRLRQAAEEAHAAASRGKEPTSSEASQAAATPAWEVPVAPALAGINLRIPHGALYAIVGPVGSGKTALCLAALGELSTAAGSVVLRGRVAYVPQQAWIINASLRSNVALAHEAATGSPPDDARYGAVLDACQLRPDLAVLPDGDGTEIGERGINLSGGQKQRVSLARAGCSPASVVVLDDPLSALDAETGKAVFEQCILGAMRGRTRLLVTNQLQYLRFCDGVVVLERGADGAGRVSMQGTYAEVSQLPAFLALMASYSAGEEGAEEGAQAVEAVAAVAPAPAAAPSAPAAKLAGRLVTEEERAEGAVTLSTWLRYFSVAGTLRTTLGLLFFAYLANQLSQFAQQWWLTFWSSDTRYAVHSFDFYIGIFGGLGAINALAGYMRVVVQLFSSLRSSTALHAALLSTILHAPLSFFDTTPGEGWGIGWGGEGGACCAEEGYFSPIPLPHSPLSHPPPLVTLQSAASLHASPRTSMQ